MMGLSAINMSPLVLEMQQNPQLKARIRNCSLYLVVPCLMLGLRDEGVFVNIKNAPDLVKA